MNQENLKNLISENIAKFRKAAGLTQAELAAKLNYSDKAVSKWERGDGMPDVVVLCEMAEIFGVTLNDFIRDAEPVKPTGQRVNKILVSVLSGGLVWLLATVSFVIMAIAFPTFRYKWMAFIYAIPVSAIVLLVFSAIWRNKPMQFAFISVIIWTVLLSVFLSLSFVPNIFCTFFLGIPVQVLFVFWYLRKKR